MPVYFERGVSTQKRKSTGMSLRRKNGISNMYYLVSNNYLRKKVWERQKKACHFCRHVKRLLQSSVFATTRNKSHWSEKRQIWIIDWSDYRWVCRDCISKTLKLWQLTTKTKQLLTEEDKSFYGW